MSSAMVRRSSSRQGLQNLLRVTAQRSVEDAEELERERRRRVREAFRSQQSLSGCACESSQDSVMSPEVGLYEGDLTPSSPVALDVDEGFSDWTQKMERRTRPKMEENRHAEESQEEDRRIDGRSGQRDKTSFTTLIQHHQTQDGEQEEIEEKRPMRRSEKHMEISEKVNSQRPEEWNEDIRDVKGRPVENKMKEKKGEVKMSYTSKVFLQQDKMPKCNEAAVEEVTSLLVKTKRSPRSVGVGHALETKKEMDAGLETGLKLEKIRCSHQEKKSQEMEQLHQQQAEAERGTEKKRKEEERRREEEEQENLTKKEITERTESLNRSLKKSNSFKKIQRPVLLPKIDDRLEQYTHAIEISSRESKMTKPAVIDMPRVSAPVASKKNLFEAGETWTQTNTKSTPAKDTDRVKVGVANMINHWVKGSPEGGIRHSPTTPSDVKAGDVLQKKNMWEIIGEGSIAERSGLGEKGSYSGKRFRFVVTGHGKYEKISTAHTNGKSGEYSSDDC